MELKTHLAASTTLVGEAVSGGPGKATASLATSKEMAVDDRGLVHGGFIFGLADLAAMAAINDPNVVLGAAEVRFLAPVRVGQVVVASAEAGGVGKKRAVEVRAKLADEDLEVFIGRFTCFVLDHHVFDKESR